MAATCSIVDEEALERTYGVPVAAAARATASSPSGCAIVSTPTGARKIGVGECVPSTSTERSRTMLPASMRGRSLRRSNASRFARIVASPPAPPAM